MKVVILCGGLGSRLAEETKLIPKPMVKIGNKPILSHIMNFYGSYGFDEFILALGYKSKIIKNFYRKKNKLKFINTGKSTMTGGRLLRLKKYFKKDETFMVTYGDGLSNQNIKNLLRFHKKHKKIATMTAVRQPARFGEIKLKGNKILRFNEKPESSSIWINGGYFVFNAKIFDFIKNDRIMLEREPLENLAKAGEVKAFKHNGFWQCMDTMRDKIFLNKILKAKKAKWVK